MTPDHWSLGVTGDADREFTAILARAINAGQGPAILAAIRDIRDYLVRIPRDFGEPLRHLRQMKMTVRNAAIRPL